MKLIRTSFLIILVLVFGSSSQVSAIGLRCGTSLITVGDKKSKIIAKCGAPDYVEEWEEERIMRDFHHSVYPESDYERGREPFLVKTFVKIEEWNYNFGSTQLIHYLRFKNGKLIKIYTGERGYETLE
jgi:hypothetical protein